MYHWAHDIVGNRIMGVYYNGLDYRMAEEKIDEKVTDILHRLPLKAKFRHIEMEMEIKKQRRKERTAFLYSVMFNICASFLYLGLAAWRYFH